MVTSEKHGRVRTVSLRPGALDVLHLWLGEQRTPAEHQADRLADPSRIHHDERNRTLPVFVWTCSPLWTATCRPNRPTTRWATTGSASPLRTPLPVRSGETVFGDTSGRGTTGLDDRYAAATVEGIGSEIMGAGGCSDSTPIPTMQSGKAGGATHRPSAPRSMCSPTPHRVRHSR